MIRRLALLGLLVAAMARGGAAHAATESALRFPVPGVAGPDIVTRLCMPDGGATTGLVLINHGTAGPAFRAALEPAGCAEEAVRYFLDRGHPVGLPLRRGHGVTGGEFTESSGPCADPDYAHAGQEAARDIGAALAGLLRRPDVPGLPALVIGHSAGGWGTLALAASDPPGVGGFVLFSPGRGGPGGVMDGMPGPRCAPERLLAAAARFGATARAPILLIHAANDRFFGPGFARRLQAAIEAAGGHARLTLAPASGEDGHGFLFAEGASAIWGPMLEGFPP
ncbi:hypothetical protein EOD42_06700 [Rhodovarius crocodyli]|uniref:Alpha/beta fold hydrolase n=1 Tax=Rhodovarius crocodyli TaxID=1979269 RepID=A0A437MIM4_9PROT|nr:hypothetical protein [Rhodovarius crocodyli]RVT97508.1 hypothetical protein EOD42_06700 [Rhodovarius crocodyli]